MGKTRHGRDWKVEHLNDPYVKQAKKDGYRSRAIYKLDEIDKKDRLFRPGMTVIDLGAAPGSWSEYAVKKVGDTGKVIALDLLEMDAIPGVTFVAGDFREQDVYDALLKEIEAEQGNTAESGAKSEKYPGKVDLVMSDMAPNISGMKVVDQPRAMHLVELSLELAQSVLKPNGVLLVKVFSGSGLEEFNQLLRQHFKRVVARKPKASRSRSAEHYLLASGYNV